MSKHTPGPWVAGEFCSESGWVEINSPGEDRLPVASATPASSHLYHGIASRRDDETKANARLIAAAPELLRALQAVVNDCHDLDMVPSNERGRTTTAFELAVSAIEKVTGES